MLNRKFSASKSPTFHILTVTAHRKKEKMEAAQQSGHGRSEVGPARRFLIEKQPAQEDGSSGKSASAGWRIDEWWNKDDPHPAQKKDRQELKKKRRAVTGCKRPGSCLARRLHWPLRPIERKKRLRRPNKAGMGKAKRGQRGDFWLKSSLPRKMDRAEKAL